MEHFNPTSRYQEINRQMNEILKPLGHLDSGDKYETFVTELLRAHGFTATKTGKADNGVDILASIAINNVERKFAIQCKFYNNTLGKAPVQQVFTGVHHSYKDALPVVITNNYMTVEARQFAYKLGVEVIAKDQWELYRNAAYTGEAPKTTKKGLLGILIGIVTENPHYSELAAMPQIPKRRW